MYKCNFLPLNMLKNIQFDSLYWSVGTTTATYQEITISFMNYSSIPKLSGFTFPDLNNIIKVIFLGV